MTLGQRIRQRRGSLQLSQARLATDLGVDQSTVAKWESGPNTPRHSTLYRLAHRLEVGVSWLLTGEEPMLKHGADTLGLSADEAVAVTASGLRSDDLNLPAGPSLALPGTAYMVRQPVSRGERDLPVFGVAVGGDDAFFEFNGQVHEYIERPSQLEGVQNAYALYMLGDSMEPRYLEGEIVYVNPNRPITRDCFVAVELKAADGGPGKGMIKQFVKRTPTKLVLRQFNPGKTLEFLADEIKHFHRIVQSGEP